MNIILFGITGFGNAVLEELLDNNLKPVKIISRLEKDPDPYLNFENIVQMANKLEIPVDVNKSYDSGKYDLCIVATYHKLINVNKCSFKNAFNIHPSLLPQFKGKDPISDVINKKNEITGVTVHRLTEKFDDGEIIFQEEIKINFLEKKEIMKLMVPVYKLMTRKIIKEFILK
jgi:methionyl-tRNA formyltransferase